MSDYPVPLVPVNHTEPVPRRVRAVPRRPGGRRHDPRPLRVGVARLPAVLRPAGRRPARRAGRRGHHRGDPAWRRAAIRRCEWAASTGRARPRSSRPRGRRTRRHRALRVVRPRRLVRGGRAGLRPPPQPVHAGRRAALDPDGARRVQRRRAGRVLLARAGLRDRPPHPLLPEPHRRRLRPAAPLGHRDRVPLQGHDQRVLVGPDRRSGSTPTSPGPTTSRPARCSPSPA